MACLNYFTTHEWRFISENPIQLLEKMSPEDRRVFYFDVRDIDWASYLETYALGTRRFILKDDPSTLPAARRHLNRYIQKNTLSLSTDRYQLETFCLIEYLLTHRMFWVQQMTRLAVFLLFWRVVVSRSENARRVWNLTLTVLLSMMQRLVAGAGIGVAK